MKEQFLKTHIKINDNKFYGLGIFIWEQASQKAYYAVGGDFGVDFFTAYFPKNGIIASALGNTEKSTYPLRQELFKILG
jgi:hypothetical protein